MTEPSPTSPPTARREPVRRGRPALWAAGFAALLAAAAILGVSIASRSLGTGASWLAILLAAVSVGCALGSLRRK